MSSRPSKDADVNQETTGDGRKEVVKVKSGEAKPNILHDSFM